MAHGTHGSDAACMGAAVHAHAWLLHACMASPCATSVRNQDGMTRHNNQQLSWDKGVKADQEGAHLSRSSAETPIWPAPGSQHPRDERCGGSQFIAK